MIDLKSWNPWHGCRKYSESCANCYLFVLDKAHKVSGQSTEIFRTRNFSKPMERDRKGNFKVLSQRRRTMYNKKIPVVDGDTRPALCVSCNSCYRTPGHACIFELNGM